MEAYIGKSDSKAGEGTGEVSEEDGVCLEDRVQYEFNEIVDSAIDTIIKHRISEKDALDVVFHIASELEVRSLLPKFPGEEAILQDMERWIQAASDFEFVQFCEDAVR
jgi:hypothetical protein